MVDFLESAPELSGKPGESIRMVQEVGDSSDELYMGNNPK